MAVPHHATAGIVLALRANDRVDLSLHHLVQHSEPDADQQRQQTLLRSTGQLSKRLLHPLRQPVRVAPSSEATSARVDTAVIATVPAVLVTSIRTRHGPKLTERGGRTAAPRFYELRDNRVTAAGEASLEFLRLVDSVSECGLDPRHEKLKRVAVAQTR